MISVLIAAACYTICGLSDKYVVSKGKLNGNEITFVMAAATAIFMAIILPVTGELPSENVTVTWQAIVAILLIAGIKLGEFKFSALVLTDMSAFELKAWVGLNMFASYFLDIFFYGETLNVISLIFIAVTGAGLFLIAKSGNQKTNYKKIVIPLILYLLMKLGYGVVMKEAKVYLSSDIILFLALIILSVALLPIVHPIKLFKAKTKGSVVCAVTKLPNAVGLFAENAAMGISLTLYAMIQPIILVALFLIGIIKREEKSKLGIIGGIVSILGVIGFQFIGK